MTKIRIAVVNSHPIQYFAPLYAYLNSQPDLEVTALYLSNVSIRGGKDAGFGREVKWDLDLLAGYQYKFIGKTFAQNILQSFWSLVAPELWWEIRSENYDALWLYGHQYAANFVALAAAKSKGIPVLMRGETHLGLKRTLAKRALRRPVMNLLYRSCDRFLAIGTANKNFYRAMGIPPDRIFLTPYAVDNDRFIRSANLAKRDRAEVRAQCGIPEAEPVILYAAKLTQRKHPEHLLEAANRLRSLTGRSHSILMVGSGELEAPLQAYCRDHGLTHVKFCGFRNQTEMPQFYAACDIFVLPSENEPWGLAINEAMCAGLPIVTTKEVGCVLDLVSDGVNGFTYQTGDVPALSNALCRLVENDELRKAQSEASRARISTWGYAECLTGFRAALKSLGLVAGANP